MANGTGEASAAADPTPDGDLPAAVIRQIADRVYELLWKELRTGRERAGLAGRGSSEP
jgi:hypothetical protein